MYLSHDLILIFSLLCVSIPRHGVMGQNSAIPCKPLPVPSSPRQHALSLPPSRKKGKEESGESVWILRINDLIMSASIPFVYRSFKMFISPKIIKL